MSPSIFEPVGSNLSDEVTCPCCGHIHTDSYEFDDYGNYTCDACEREFEYQRHVTVQYTSRKLEADQ